MVICMQNRVREMLEQKLREADEKTANLLKEVEIVELKANKFEQELELSSKQY